MTTRQDEQDDIDRHYLIDRIDALVNTIIAADRDPIGTAIGTEVADAWWAKLKFADDTDPEATSAARYWLDHAARHYANDRCKPERTYGRAEGYDRTDFPARYARPVLNDDGLPTRETDFPHMADLPEEQYTAMMLRTSRRKESDATTLALQRKGWEFWHACDEYGARLYPHAKSLREALASAGITWEQFMAM